MHYMFSKLSMLSPSTYVGMPKKCNFSWDLLKDSGQMLCWGARWNIAPTDLGGGSDEEKGWYQS